SASSTGRIRSSVRTASSCRSPRRLTQLLELVISLGGPFQQSLLALGLEEFQRRLHALVFELGRDFAAPCAVVQLPQRFLRLAQVLERGLLRCKSLVCKKIFQGIDGVGEFLVEQPQPVPLLRAHLAELAAFLQELSLPFLKFRGAVGADWRCSFMRRVL